MFDINIDISYNNDSDWICYAILRHGKTIPIFPPAMHHVRHVRKIIPLKHTATTRGSAQCMSVINFLNPPPPNGPNKRQLVLPLLLASPYDVWP